jgi:DNA-binding CsgD family transcriptional regulator
LLSVTDKSHAEDLAMFATCLNDRDDRQPAESARGPRYSGPERRARSHWLTSAFDEIDFGVLLLSMGAEIRYTNRAAASALAGSHPLRVSDQRVAARDPRDAARLTAALQEAGIRGFRKLLALGSGTAQATVAVIPLAHPQAMGEANVMLMLSRCGVATPLAAEAFARSYGLTSAETRVLLALCNGKVPQEIARDAEVEISTVRTQLGNIRQKTGAQSLRSLVAQVAALPPFMGILGPKPMKPPSDEHSTAGWETFQLQGA